MAIGARPNGASERAARRGRGQVEQVLLEERRPQEREAHPGRLDALLAAPVGDARSRVTPFGPSEAAPPETLTTCSTPASAAASIADGLEQVLVGAVRRDAGTAASTPSSAGAHRRRVGQVGVDRGQRQRPRRRAGGPARAPRPAGRRAPRRRGGRCGRSLRARAITPPPPRARGAASGRHARARGADVVAVARGEHEAVRAQQRPTSGRGRVSQAPSAPGSTTGRPGGLEQRARRRRRRSRAAQPSGSRSSRRSRLREQRADRAALGGSRCGRCAKAPAP